MAEVIWIQGNLEVSLPASHQLNLGGKKSDRQFFPEMQPVFSYPESYPSMTNKHAACGNLPFLGARKNTSRGNRTTEDFVIYQKTVTMMEECSALNKTFILRLRDYWGSGAEKMWVLEIGRMAAKHHLLFKARPMQSGIHSSWGYLYWVCKRMVFSIAKLEWRKKECGGSERKCPQREWHFLK